MKNHQVLIIGAGTAGIMVASQLKRRKSGLDIAILDPSEKHAYQPAWTLVGGGTYDYDKTIRSTASLIPSGVTWIKEFAETIDAENKVVKTKDGNEFGYEYLVVCPGIQIDLDGIEGLKDAIGKNGVCSNYVDSKYTWEVLRNFKGGNAVFTQPTTPIKCGGAPQKIAYLAAHYFQKNGLDSKSEVIFATPGSVIFGVKDFAKTLMQVIGRYGIHFKPFYAPVKIDGEKKEVTFKAVHPEENQCVINEGNSIGETMHGESTIVMPYDMLHLAPPQSAPDFIKKSPLANGDGWLDVDHFTMQHNKFSNVFGLGDTAALPTAKTGAAIRKQAPVVVENIIRMMDSNVLGSKKYDGYSSCPLVTGYGKMILAEFIYGNERQSDPMLSKMMDTSKEHWRLWILKKYGLPYLYWNKMMKGKEV